MLDVLVGVAATVTIVGGLAAAFRAVHRKRVTRRAGTQDGSLLHVVTDFTGRALSAHGRLVVLGKLQGSWFPMSEATAARFGEPLLNEAGPIASLRADIRLAGDSKVNQAADDVLRVLEETARLLTERKSVLRRVHWENREESIREAIQSLETVARAFN